MNKSGKLPLVCAAKGEGDGLCGWLLLAWVPALLQRPCDLEDFLESEAGQKQGAGLGR